MKEGKCSLRESAQKERCSENKKSGCRFETFYNKKKAAFGQPFKNNFRLNYLMIIFCVTAFSPALTE